MCSVPDSILLHHWPQLTHQEQSCANHSPWHSEYVSLWVRAEWTSPAGEDINLPRSRGEIKNKAEFDPRGAERGKLFKAPFCRSGLVFLQIVNPQLNYVPGGAQMSPYRQPRLRLPLRWLTLFCLSVENRARWIYFCHALSLRFPRFLHQRTHFLALFSPLSFSLFPLISSKSAVIILFVLST